MFKSKHSNKELELNTLWARRTQLDRDKQYLAPTHYYKELQAIDLQIEALTSEHDE